MDVHSMLNGGPAPEKSKGSAPPLASPPPAQNGSYALPRHTPGQQTPLFAPPSASHSQSRGLTPLQTPSHASNGGQYPFPQQHQTMQSPASAHPSHQSQTYRSFEPQSATTPGPRPSSHGYPYPQRSPSLGQYHQAMNPHGTASLSPTPSSHHSQTPHSVRQSPLATMSHPPSHLGQPPPPQHFHQSQPNTPLGPPQPPQRYSNSQLDVASPQHSRTLSGASSGMMAASPQHHGSINSIVESPSLHTRPSPHTRRTSDYRSSMDRERSVSVSPKTMVPPRSSSHSSRHSSQQDMYNSRGSQQLNASVARSETPGHVQPHTPNHAQPPRPSLVGEVPQIYPQSSSSSAGPPANGGSLSSAVQQPELQKSDAAPMQHQSQKMSMSQLLAPAQISQSSSSLPNGSAHHKPTTLDDGTRQSQERSLPPSHIQNAQANTSTSNQLQTMSHTTTVTASDSKSPQVMAQPPSNKRRAESDASAPPAKKSKRRQDRPIWAQLHPSNPRYSGPPPMSQTLQQSHVQPRQETKPPPPSRQPEGPDLFAQFSRWEKSIKALEPIQGLTKAITDHLWINLENNSDVGRDAREGTIEIEAKIGTLIDVNTGRRCEITSLNPVVIPTRCNRQYRFDSEMNEAEHRSMNKFLNEEVKESHAKANRVNIQYEHLHETDHFQSLSDAGSRALPEAAHRRHNGRDLRLRTSIADKDGRVTGRIVKIKLGEDLHIFGAEDPYDIRISMNLEVNLADRPDLDPNSLVAAGGPTLPTRKKDRLSYKHLAYQVDLTRVDSEGMPPKYELELEVDANVLRQQMGLQKMGQPNRMADVVDGFVNNMAWLMRVQRQQQ